MLVVGRRQHLALVDEVDAQRLEHARLDDVPDAALRHHRDRDRGAHLLDALDRRHARDAALAADVGGHALERHHRGRAGVLGDARLLGVGDVEDDAALQHLGEAGLQTVLLRPSEPPWASDVDCERSSRSGGRAAARQRRARDLAERADAALDLVGAAPAPPRAAATTNAGRRDRRSARARRRRPRARAAGSSASVSIASGSVTQTTKPPSGRVNVEPSGRCRSSAASAAVEAPRDLARDPLDVPVVAAGAAEVRQRRLQQRARREVDRALQRRRRLGHAPVGDEPADAHAREERLREGADVDHVAGAIERPQRRRGAAAHAQVVLEVVLEDRHAVPGGDLEQPPAVLERGRDAGRILEGGHRVDEAHAAAREQRIERVEIEPRRHPSAPAPAGARPPAKCVAAPG